MRYFDRHVEPIKHDGYTPVLERSTGRELTYDEMDKLFTHCPVCDDFVLDGQAYWEIALGGEPKQGHIVTPVLTIYAHKQCASGGIYITAAEGEE